MYKLKPTLIVILLVILSTVSCKNIFRKDFSLTPQQYMGLGMPAYNNTWTEKDYQKAEEVISNLRIKNFYSLPRKDSRKSGILFTRISSKDNFAFLEDQSLSLRDKAYKIQSLGNLIGQMGTLYTDKLRTRQYYGKELIEIYVLHLYLRHQMLELAEKINKSVSQEDIALQSGRNGIVSSYVLLLEFLVSEKEKTQAFSSRELRRLNKELLNSITINLKYLDAENKQRIYTFINKSIEKYPSGSNNCNLKEILRLLS